MIPLFAASISRAMNSSITDLREDSYESLACCICCLRKDTLSSSSFGPADRVILKSVALAERGTYFVSSSIRCRIDFLLYRLQRAVMILWPKWRISGCRLVGSDATANSRASLAAFVGELGVELGGDFWVSCSSSGSCVRTLLGTVRVLLVALEFMLSVSHTLNMHHCERSEQRQNGRGLD